MNDKISKSHYFLCVIHRALRYEAKVSTVIPRVLSITLLLSLHFTFLSCITYTSRNIGCIQGKSKGLAKTRENAKNCSLPQLNPIHSTNSNEDKVPLAMHILTQDHPIMQWVRSIRKRGHVLVWFLGQRCLWRIGRQATRQLSATGWACQQWALRLRSRLSEMKARKEVRGWEGGKRRKNSLSSKFERELKKLECLWIIRDQKVDDQDVERRVGNFEMLRGAFDSITTKFI